MTHPVQQPACGTRNLTKIFGSGDEEVVAVDDVTVTIERGTFG